MKFGLESMRALMEELGHPERAWPSLLVAGTNGKGSVVAVVDQALRDSGLRVGRYTSPHLVRLHERIAVDGRLITDGALERAVRRVRDAAEALVRAGRLPAHPTHFEAVTAAAFLHFAARQVDVAVLEVGLGGRLDATNVCDPVASAIVTIARDHEAQLGRTLPAIAREKAGVLRRGRTCVLGALPAAARRAIGGAARKAGARLRDATLEGGVRETAHGLEVRTAARVHRGLLPLPGAHQVGNLRVALALLEEAERAGVRVRWSRVAGRGRAHPLARAPADAGRTAGRAPRRRAQPRGSARARASPRGRPAVRAGLRRDGRQGRARDGAALVPAGGARGADERRPGPRRVPARARAARRCARSRGRAGGDAAPGHGPRARARGDRADGWWSRAACSWWATCSRSAGGERPPHGVDGAPVGPEAEVEGGHRRRHAAADLERLPIADASQGGGNVRANRHAAASATASGATRVRGPWRRKKSAASGALPAAAKRPSPCQGVPCARNPRPLRSRTMRSSESTSVRGSRRDHSRAVVLLPAPEWPGNSTAAPSTTRPQPCTTSRPACARWCWKRRSSRGNPSGRGEPARKGGTWSVARVRARFTTSRRSGAASGPVVRKA
jgi:hypothetical protein